MQREASVSLNDLEKLIDAGPKQPAPDRPRVVVVDDDASIRSALIAVLKGDYDVRTCKNAVEAVREIDEATDCVILDVKMPNHDGFWLAEQLRTRNQDVAIIFHSAYQDVKDPYDVINEFRPFGYVVKGDTLATLLGLVGKAVKLSQRVKDRQRTLDRLREARAKMQDVHRLPDGQPHSKGGERER
jgi:DNA-binding NtrC family response regulator